MDISVLNNFCDRKDIAVFTFQKAVELANAQNVDGNLKSLKLLYHARGVALRTEEGNLIMYDGALPIDDQYFTFAHEIAHCVLEHLTEREFKLSKEMKEMEANIFASVLMALNVYSECREYG